MTKEEFINEFEDNFVGDNWTFGIGYGSWEMIKPWLEKKFDEMNKREKSK